MGESISAIWAEVFESRGRELHPCAGPEGSTAEETWHEGLSAFEKHSFVRLMLRAPDQSAQVVVELAAGPPESLGAQLARAARDWLNRATPVDWSTSSVEMPIQLRATLTHPDALYATLDALLAFMSRASEVDRASDWLTFFGPSEPSSPSLSTPSAGSASPAASPFETIGQPKPDAPTPARAQRLEIVDSPEEALRLDVHLSAALASAESQRLAQALSHYLHTRYDVRAHHAPETSSPHTLSLTVLPDRYLGSKRELLDDLKRFCKRLGDYIDAGGELQDYLGINDVVLPSARQTGSDSAPSASRSARAPAPRQTLASDAESGVVFDLSSASNTSAGELVQGDFSDTRLQRDDARTALVDLVLRHPGYSDRRINQVLTILLSIDYAAAQRLSESAPCVIAWGLSRERALSFKDVLESAGGKALLVEPGTFGES